jgi:hypothetical protein
MNLNRLINSVIEVQGEEAMIKHSEVVSIDIKRVKPVY